MSSSGTRRKWGQDAEGPWWRFIPRNKAAGLLSLIAGVLLAAQSAYYLAVAGGDSMGTTVVEVVVGVLGLLLILRSIDGLRVLERHPPLG